jgi:type II secretory pathway pseudopilin PulG
MIAMRTAMNRSAFSLLEVIIVLTITSLVMAAMLQSMMGIQQYASTTEVQDDLTVEGQRILTLIQEDLSASGWYLPYGQPDKKTNDRNNIFFPYVQVQQENKLGTKFPHHDRTLYKAKDWVTIKHYPGLPGSPADATATTLDDNTYRNSFYAKSQELIFLKVFDGTYSSSPQRMLEPIDFSDRNGATYTSTNRQADLGVLQLTQWKRGDYLNATDGRYYHDSTKKYLPDVLVPGAWLQNKDTSAGEWPMRVVLRWETMTKYPNISAATTTVAPRIQTVDLREYSYVVIPNPSNDNRGRLVRAYKKPTADYKDVTGSVTPGVSSSDIVLAQGSFNPDGTALDCSLVVDKVVSDRVDRIVFDTFRTDRQVDPNDPTNASGNNGISGLEINQVRVRVFMSKKGTVDIGASQSRVIEAIISMRSTSDSGALNTIAPLIGEDGTVILH